jgi:hypothetical protein
MAKTVSRNHIARLLRMATVEAAQDVMADFMLRKVDSSTPEGRLRCWHRHDQDAPIWTLADDNGLPRRAT